MSTLRQERLMQILLAPSQTEKAEMLADQKLQITFKVIPDANKQEIKDAVELMFKVKVASVRTLNIKGKRKTFGRIRGKRPDWKKAYVALKPGYDINFATL
jgi:large subunit ribosomal protein L23